MVPGTAKNPTHIRLVAIAFFIGSASHFLNSGTITMPPPTPSKPDSPPAITPTPIARTVIDEFSLARSRFARS